MFAVGANFNAVSCTSQVFCVADGADGNAVTWNGTSWAPSAFIDPTKNLSSVSCASSSFCVAVDYGGRAMSWNGSSWSAPVNIDGGPALNSVSCSSASFCVAVDGGGHAVIWNGTSWAAPVLVDQFQILGSVSCSSSTFCAAVDYAGNAVTWNGSSWSAPVAVDTNLNSVSCTSSTFCVAVSGDGNAFTWTGSSWSAPVFVTDNLWSVSCSAADFCGAVDLKDNAVTWNGTSWTAPATIDGSGLDSVSCTSSTFCAAVDTLGSALIYSGATTAGTLSVMMGATNPVAVNTADSVAPSFTDTGGSSGDSYTCSITWGDASPPVATFWAVNNPPGSPATCATAAGQATPPNHVYASDGVYTVTVTIGDSDGSTASASVLAVVYDPSAGFVTGDGWVSSPQGAYVANGSLAGRASFGFVSQYHKGATVPDGQTAFQFQLAGFNFHSTAYQWLVVSGAKAQYKGTGEVNGVTGYGFLLTALDGDLTANPAPDGFRIKIWQINTGGLVYDNVLGTSDDLSSGTEALGGGTIVIHKS